MKDIKHSIIPHVYTQEEDKEENEDLFESCLEKIGKKMESKNLESSKVDDIHYNITGSIQVQGTTLSPRLT